MVDFINQKYVQRLVDGKPVGAVMPDGSINIRSSDTVSWAPLLHDSNTHLNQPYHNTHLNQPYHIVDDYAERSIHAPKALVKHPSLAESKSLAGWLYRRDIRAACEDTMEIHRDAMSDYQKFMKAIEKAAKQGIMGASTPYQQRLGESVADKALKDLNDLRSYCKGPLGIAHDHVTEED